MPVFCTKKLIISVRLNYYCAFYRKGLHLWLYTPISVCPPTVRMYRANATAFCLNADCSATQPIASLNQLRVPAGGLGDFFGPGTTVGIPFAAQLGIRLSF